MDSVKALLLLFTLFGCYETSPWNVSYLEGGDSSRVSCLTRDKVNGVGVEMVYAKNSLRTYLEVHSQSIPPYRGNEQEALVILKTATQVIRTVASRHAGGQRLLLPSDSQQILIDNLLEGESVTIELQGYRQTLSPDHFSNKFSKIKKIPLNIPIQLPFKL